MRAFLPLAALALLAGCASLTPRRAKVYKPKPAIDQTEATRAAQEWRELMGMKKLVSTSKVTAFTDVGVATNEPSDWMVEGVDDKGEKWYITVSRKTGRVLGMRKDPSMMTAASGARLYTRGEDALKDISKKLEPFLAGHEVTLTSFDMGAEMAPGALFFGGMSRSMAGAMSAHYSVLAHGRPFLAGGFGIDVELDPATGAVIYYDEALDTPPIGSPIPLVLPIAAIATAEKEVGVKPGTFASVNPILGWAVPPGGKEAKLYYYINASSGSVRYSPTFVSAETGKADAALAASMGTPGSWASGSRIRVLRSAGSSYSIYMSGTPYVPPPAKKSTGKKP